MSDLIEKYVNYGSPIKDWTLLRCLVRDDDSGVNVGQWILVYSSFLQNSYPRIMYSFVFDSIQFNTADLVSDDVESFVSAIDDFEDSFNTDPQTGFGFYQCCLDDGFDPFNFNDFYIWVAEKMITCIVRAQDEMSKNDLERILEHLVVFEMYEKAALVRDRLDGKVKQPYRIF